jgi:hypothetical protein
MPKCECGALVAKAGSVCQHCRGAEIRELQNELRRMKRERKLREAGKVK